MTWIKKGLSLLLACCLCLGAAAMAEEVFIDNWYEVFVYSFADGDGDRYGDFKGLMERLPYIHDMGFRGIWLMPIHPSPSYHKYDVADYYAIDPLYGTLQDFKDFLEAAHALGIHVIMDLVVNHTSSDHPWFQQAKADRASPFRDYYSFSDTQMAGYTALPDGTFFESRFVSTMPDLNLHSDAVREEIRAIMAYWLTMGVDGFRLDAVTSFFTGKKEENIAFLRWLSDTAKEIAPDCFIIGECWDNLSVIADYYESGIDSFFLFPASQGGGYIGKALTGDIQNRGEAFGQSLALLEETFGERIQAPFLGNHDTPRIASVLGPQAPATLKMAAGMLAMMKGTLFAYYGDEIGMIGSANDPQKRLGMFWDEKKNITFCPPGTTMPEYPMPSVAEQLAKDSSLLNYYKAAMHLRLDFPMIARGDTDILQSPHGGVCLIERIWQGDTLLIAMNLSPDDITFALPAGYSALVGDLEVWGQAEIVDGALMLPSYGIALIQ